MSNIEPDINHGPISLSVLMTRGDDFIREFRIGGKPTPNDPTEYWNLTGWTLRGQVRKKASSDVLATMNVTPLLDQAGADKGKFKVHIPKSLPGTPGTGMFPTECVGDIEFLDPSENLRTYFRLDFIVILDITRDDD